MRIKMMSVFAILLALVGGCGPDNRGPKDNRPPNRPPAGQPADDGWISFIAEVLDEAGINVPRGETGTITLAALDHDLQPMQWTNGDTQMPAVPIETDAHFPAAMSVRPAPTAFTISFTASAFIPTGWYLYCEVRRGKIESGATIDPSMPVISSNKSLPAGPGLGASGVGCSYPELPTGVEPKPRG